MSWLNFNLFNAKNYYVIAIPSEDEEDNDFAYDDAVHCVQLSGTEEGFDIVKSYDRRKHDRDMGTCILSKNEGWSSRYKCDETEIRIKKEIYVVPGYYTGATLDYKVVVDNSASVYDINNYGSPEDMAEDMVNDLIDYFEWYGVNSCGWNVGTLKIQRKNYKKWIVSQIEKALDELDEFCKNNCENVYVLGGVFSNGEAIYYQADTIKGKLAEKYKNIAENLQM